MILNWILGLFSWKFWLLFFLVIIALFWMVKGNQSKKDEYLGNAFHYWSSPQRQPKHHESSKPKQKEVEETKEDRKIYRQELEKIMCDVARELYPSCEFKTVRPDWLKNPDTGKNLELDCYCESLGINFEGHGIQHLQYPNPISKSEEEFIQQVKRDQYKAEQCELNDVFHLEIPFMHVVPPRSTYLQARKHIRHYIQDHTKELNHYLYG